MSDALLTHVEAAERLGISPRSLDALVDAGAVHVVDVSPPGAARRARRYRPADLEAFIAARRSPAAVA